MAVIYYRHGESGASILDAASVDLNLRQGWKPEGRRRFTGSVHDSRVPSGTTPGKEKFISISVAE